MMLVSRTPVAWLKEFRGKSLQRASSISCLILLLIDERDPCCYWRAGQLLLFVSRTTTIGVVVLLRVYLCSCWCKQDCAC